MNTAVTTYNFTPSLDLRAVNINSEPWFVAKDVCKALDLAQVHKAVAGLDPDEQSHLPKGEHCSGLPNRGVTIINESGLYSLILKSRKPEAKAFKKWVTSVVLPSIRKTGTFTVPTKAALPPVPQDYVSALKELIQSLECQAALKGENEALKIELVQRVDLSQWKTGKEIRQEVGVYGRLSH